MPILPILIGSFLGTGTLYYGTGFLSRACGWLEDDDLVDDIDDASRLIKAKKTVRILESKLNSTKPKKLQ